MICKCSACRYEGSGDIVILETKRLILRDWDENDIDDLVEGLNNIEVSKWLAYVPHPFTKKMPKDGSGTACILLKKGWTGQLSNLP